MKTKKFNSPKVQTVTELEHPFRKNGISARVNGREYIGSYDLIGDIKAVTYLREVNSTKQTTRAIRFAVENKIN
jgi:hypothetical protein